MDQKECNIIIDLLPNYIEGDISNDTKRFIDEHLNKCLKCRDTLKAMKEDITEEDKRIRIDNDIMTNKIKKIKRKMMVKKYFLRFTYIVILFLFIIGIVYLVRNNYILENTNKAYDKLTSLNNYRLTTYSIYQNYNGDGDYNYYNILSYKDGKYKEELYDGISSNKLLESINYGEIESNEKINVSYNEKKITKKKNTSIYYKKGQLVSNSFRDTICNGKERWIYIFSNVSIGKFRGKDCYVYRIQWGKDGYVEYWIEKDTFFNVREVESYSNYYRETLYLLEENCVKDEELQIETDIQGFEYQEIETNELTDNVDINLYIKESVNLQND